MQFHSKVSYISILNLLENVFYFVPILSFKCP
jgi:hypothetical protein